MNPYTEHFRAIVGDGVHPSLGPVYKTVLHQRGYGFGQRPGRLNYRMTQGMGWGEILAKALVFAKPLLTKGLRYLGSQAVGAVSNIAGDAMSGQNIGVSAKKHLSDVAGTVFAKAPGVIVENVLKRAGLKRESTSRESGVQGSTTAKKRRRAGKKNKNKIGSGLLKQYPGLGKLG